MDGKASSPLEWCCWAVWDLRCQLREKLLGFMLDTFPESLPKARAYLSSDYRLLNQPPPGDGAAAKGDRLLFEKKK